MRLDAPGKSMSHIPVMDQDSKWICYAYSASQMYDAWRFSHGDQNYKHLTSPVATSVFYAAQSGDPKRKDVDFGVPTDAVAAIKRNGSCDYRSIYTKLGQHHLAEYFGELKQPFDEMALQTVKSPDPDSSADALYKNSKRVQCAMQNFGGSAIPDLSEIMDSLAQPTYLKYLENLFKSACAGITTPAMQIPQTKMVTARSLDPRDRSAKFSAMINDQLSGSNPQPMAVQICENVLWDHNTAGVSDQGGFIKENCRSEHVVTVIGRRTNSAGKCEFLLRNSYGTTCWGFPEGNCEQGTAQLWVESGALARNMLSLGWIPDK